jgi:hypothetical protein
MKDMLDQLVSVHTVCIVSISYDRRAIPQAVLRVTDPRTVYFRSDAFW